MEQLSSLFIGYQPDEVFDVLFGWLQEHPFSVDIAELFLVFGTIAVSLGIMVWFGNWWSR